MVRRKSTLTLSLCTSMVVHAVVLYLMAWWYLRHPPSLRLAALSAPERLAPIIVPAPPPPPPPPPPKDFSQATEKPLRDDSGEAKGKGIANRSTPGEKPMEARQGLDQANLDHSAKNEADDSQDDLPTPAQAAAIPTPPAPVQTPTPGLNVSQAAAAPPVATAQQIKGHAVRPSDTDSFAMVSQSNNVRFHDGKMDAREGRRVKTTRPEYGLSAMTDAVALNDVSMIFGVTVDATGAVTDVVILHSSGSENIDQPTKRAIYNWWFEPKKDENGRGLPDRWVVHVE